MSNCLLIVDMQLGFYWDGFEDLAGRICEEAQSGKYGHIVASYLKNSKDAPFAKLANYEGCMQPREQLNHVAIKNVAKMEFAKSTSSSLTVEFYQWLMDNKIDTVYLCGVDTDCCVMSTAFSLFDLGIKPVVLANLCECRSSKDLHECALRIIKHSLGSEAVQNARPWAATVPTEAVASSDIIAQQNADLFSNTIKPSAKPNAAEPVPPLGGIAALDLQSEEERVLEEKRKHDANLLKLNRRGGVTLKADYDLEQEIMYLYTPKEDGTFELLSRAPVTPEEFKALFSHISTKWPTKEPTPTVQATLDRTGMTYERYLLNYNVNDTLECVNCTIGYRITGNGELFLHLQNDRGSFNHWFSDYYKRPSVCEGLREVASYVNLDITSTHTCVDPVTGRLCNRPVSEFKKRVAAAQTPQQDVGDKVGDAIGKAADKLASGIFRIISGNK